GGSHSVSRARRRWAYIAPSACQRGGLLQDAGPGPTDHNCAARLPGNRQRAERYQCRLRAGKNGIVKVTPDNVGPKVAEVHIRAQPENDAASKWEWRRSTQDAVHVELRIDAVDLNLQVVVAQVVKCARIQGRHCDPAAR